MRELHRELGERYRTLRESRRGPVFFVEHGLSDGEVADLFADVRQHLVAHPLESGWWNLNSLPLLVASTEVGYRYRGSGTDFWPVLETELGVKVSATDRQWIRDLFSNASKSYRGAEPPNTPWARAFRLIAWPITHALVPLEFHRPLALTLANLRVKVGELSDADLHRAVRTAASSTSARFLTLLENSTLVVAVTRRLLGDATGELCPDTMRRIAEDLAADQVTRRAVAVARRVQRTVVPKPSKALLPSIVGSLHLRRRDSAMNLEAVFPPTAEDVQARLRRALRRRRYAARLWGVSTPVPSVQLLSCLPFTVKLTTVPPEDSDLLPNLDQVDIDPELRDVLAALELDIAHPLLFAVSPDEAHGRQIRGSSISGDRKYWLLSRSGEGPRGCPALGEVGPYDCHLLDPAEESVREALHGLGFQVRFGVSVEFAGSPPLDRDAPVPEFAVDDRRIVVPRRPPPEGLSVQLGDEQVRLTNDDVATVVIERGDHTLRVSNGENDRDYSFRGTPSSQSVPPVACSIEARSTELTVQALLGGVLDFAVECSASLEGLELTVEIDANGRKLFATAPLGPLPCTVSSDQEPFSTLLNDETRGLLAQAPSPTLRLSVGRLCSRIIVLEQRVRPCWWKWADDDSVALMSEIGALPFGLIPATAPAARPVPGPDNLLEETRLLVPLELDVSEYGDAAQFTTLCIAPSRVQLEVPAIKKPHLARRRRAGQGALGIEDLIESYLRWSLAESPTIIAEIRRRQVVDVLDGWIAEICCGEEWVRREAQMGGIDPWEELARLCDVTGLGRDSYIQLSREDEFKVARIAVREIRLELPDVWARVGSSCDLRPEDYEALDLACGRAYTKLAGAYREQGRAEMADEIAEGDPGAASEEWDSVLERVKSAAELQPLAELLLPSGMAHRLMTLEPSMMTLDELTEELTWWARDARRALAGSVPTAETLKVILALWIEPEAAVRLDWRGALNALLAERPVARAERYLALRSRRTARRDSTQ